METTVNLLRKAVYGVVVVLHDYVLFRHSATDQPTLP
jgi:hypothetical protein